MTVMKRPSPVSVLLGFVIGLVVGPVIAGLIADQFANMQTRRLTAPAVICVESPSACEPVGELVAGTVLEVDSKGFAHVFLRVEPGVGPRGIEPAPGAPRQRLMLQRRGP